MKKKIIITLLLLILCLFSLNGCKNNNSVKTTSTNDTTEEDTEPVISDLDVPEEISTLSELEHFDISSVSVTSDNTKMYIVASEMSEEEENSMYMVFEYTNTDGVWGNEKQIIIPNEYVCFYGVISPVGDKFYMSIAKKGELLNEETELNLNIAVGTLNNAEVTDIKYIDQLSSDNIDIISAIDSDGNLYYLSENCDLGILEAYIGLNNDGEYTKEIMPEKINDGVGNIMGLSISPEGDQMILSKPAVDSEYQCNSLFYTHKENGEWIEPVILEGGISDGIEDKLFSNISGDGTMLYYVSTKSDLGSGGEFEYNTTIFKMNMLNVCNLASEKILERQQELEEGIDDTSTTQEK